jgi:hypothetical protein
MLSAQKYTRSEVVEFIEELIKVTKAIKNWPGVTKVYADFVTKHPWAKKYASTESEEARYLKRLAEKEDFGFMLISEYDERKRWRHDRQTKRMLHFRTLGDDIHDRLISIHFEEQEDGVYAPIDIL